MSETNEPAESKSAVRRGPPTTRQSPPHEPPPEQQLQSVMEQIKAATGVTADEPLPPAPPPPTLAMVQQPPKPPKAIIVSQGTLEPFDVVQIMNRESRQYGIMFIVGNTDGPRVHGFYFTTGGKKEFVTVNISELTHNDSVALIGSSRVRAREACSSKWQMDHGKPNNL